jgi:phospholipid transport system substrate-binding protein
MNGLQVVSIPVSARELTGALVIPNPIGHSAQDRKKEIMNRRHLGHILASAMFALASLSSPLAHAADEAPDALISRLSAEVLDAIKSDKSIKAGDVGKIIALVDSKIMPNVNFQRMTASAVGPAWRQATPEQKAKLQEEFKSLLVRTYSGALAQVSDDQAINVKPMRSSPSDTEVVVRSEVKGKGEPVQLEYRLEKTPGQGAGWKIFNLNVLGVWLVDTYRSQFAAEINAKGIDGLIATLAARNQTNAGAKKS